MRLLLLVLIGLCFIHCQRQKPKPKHKKKVSAESIVKPVVWDSLYNVVPMITFPYSINASTYFKGAIEFDYVKKFLDGQKVQVKEGNIETIHIKDARSTSFYYIGKFKISESVIGFILYNGELQEFYVVSFEKSTGKWIDALEVAKIRKKENGSEILECVIPNSNELHLTYQFLSKVLEVEDIPPTKLIYQIQTNGKFLDMQSKLLLPVDSLNKPKQSQ